jgi:hypothetical protein
MLIGANEQNNWRNFSGLTVYIYIYIYKGLNAIHFQPQEIGVKDDLISVRLHSTATIFTTPPYASIWVKGKSCSMALCDTCGFEDATNLISLRG